MSGVISWGLKGAKLPLLKITVHFGGAQPL